MHSVRCVPDFLKNRFFCSELETIIKGENIVRRRVLEYQCVLQVWLHSWKEDKTAEAVCRTSSHVLFHFDVDNL